ncbi:MAG: Cadherin domain protein [Planctomycetaceae bacterium]|nr:Cadherin domain protein [Planctomycetaceae bacterium]
MRRIHAQLLLKAKQQFLKIYEGADMLINLGLRSLARLLIDRWHGRRTEKRRTGKRSVLQVSVEFLESRQLLTNFTVTTAADDSTDDSVMSLREAIVAANTSTGADTITFAPGLSGQRILLTQGQLIISDPVTITGLGATNTVIDAQLNSRVFDLTINAGDVTFDGLTVTGGRTNANGARGAGVYSYSDGTFTLSNSTITANATFGTFSQGGGIFSFVGPVTLINSTVSGNSTSGDTAPGGGIGSNIAPITLVNSTISGNTTQGLNSSGAGIATYAGNIKLTNSTVAFNSATGGSAGGGGLFSGATSSQPHSVITVNNSIIAKNSTAHSTATDFFEGTGVTTLNVNNSLIGVNTGSNLAAAPVGSPDANGNLIGTSASPIDPRLAALALNGGSTKSHALLPDSPALDAGNNSLAVDANNVVLTSDQAGQLRIFHGTVDMGSFELQSTGTSGPNVSFNISSQSVSEAAGTITLTVNLSAPTSQAVTIPFSVSGTATNSSDYTISSSPLVIPANSTSASIQLSIIDDTVVENNETVVVTLGTPTNASLGSPTAETITILDNDSSNGNGAPTNITLSSNTVSENVPNGLIGNLTATDPNPGDTATFSIQPGGQGSQFIIVGNQLKVGSTGLDFESLPQGMATVTIRATDSTGLFLDKTFVINVTNANDAPVIPAGQVFSVAEAAPVGTVVGTIIATDQDTTAPNNTLTYSIFGGNTNDAFAINPATGQLTVTNPAALNVSTNQHFNLLVTVSDGGSPSLSMTQLVRVNVGSTNQAPTIPSGQSFTISDTAVTNSIVGTVFAFDPDSTAPNNTLTYSIVGGNTNNAFAINSVNGQLSVNNAAALDATTMPLYSLLIRVSDGGSPSLSATQSVAIHVVHSSTSNHAPTILSNQVFSVPENSPVNTAVGTVIATDPDPTAPNNTLTYSIIGGNGSNTFAINSVTGLITVLHPSTLNFEATPVFLLEIKVMDGGSPALSATRTVRINVTDVNEAPSIPAGQVFTVPEFSATNSVVGTVVATDPDRTAPNKTLTYSITSGNTNQAFAINSATGQLTVNTPNALDQSSNPTFALVVTATDGGGLSASQTVVVNVTGPNQAPVITNPSTPVVYHHHGSNSVPVLPNITVSDPDSPTDLAQVILSVPIPSGARNGDFVNIGALAALGSVRETFTGGRDQVTITLRSGVTTDQVQNALRAIRFSTRGSSLNDSIRDLQVQVIDRHGAASNVISQQIIVSRK